VLVDQRLRDLSRLRDLVDRRPVVAAAREHVLRGGEDRAPPFLGSQPAARFRVLCASGHDAVLNERSVS
jgi:hypothetical protein